MAPARGFAALIDQDSVIVLEYAQEKGGFRLVDTRASNRRFTTPDTVADALIELLADMKAKKPALSIVLQHFGSFFHTLVMPSAPEEVLRPAILREVQRSFNIMEPAIAFASGPSVERRDPSRAGGQVPRQVFIAGAPKTVIETLALRLSRAGIRVDGLTVIPEVFRRLYDALDGSTEATAMLVCLHNGPHVAFFVNGQLELAIEPPLALEGEAPLDSAVIIDQLERGAIFLRQQARGTVATRLLLAAPAPDYENLASIIEARTGMRVAPLGQGIGSPESVVAMGAVLAARVSEKLDIYPRAPAFDQRLRGAMTGPSLLSTTLLTAAAVGVFWSAMQVLTMQRARADVERLQAQVARALPALSTARESVQGRERIAAIRAALQAASLERAAAVQVMSSVAYASQPGTRVDSVTVIRVEAGMRTKLFCIASAATGPAAMSAATSFYRHFRGRPELKDLGFESAYVQRMPAPGETAVAPGEDLRFTISFVSPVGDR
jgi:hypothetical protein